MIINFADVDKYNPSKVLQRISDQSIYEYYLNHSIKAGEFYNCCFHNDKTPSLSFKRMKSGVLIYNCFGCGAKGGIFDFVSNLRNLTRKEAIEDIVNNLEGSNKSYIRTENKIIYNSSKANINPIYRPFNIIDYNYWSRYYISLNLLLIYNIKPASAVYITKKSGELFLIEETKNNPIYVYKVGSGYKVYRPLNPSKKGKWYSTTDSYDIQGLEQLPSKDNLLIITSSLKDVLVLKLMGYNAIALGGEGNSIPNKVLDYLYACFDNIIVFYDNDEAGIRYADKLSNEIGAGYIYIPLEYSDTKDISDFVDKYDLDAGKILMSKLI